MYCAFCGKQIANDAAFCRYCGKPVSRDDSLAELVDAARRGSQDAVSALYEKTYSKVYYTVKSMIKDEDAVFDIVQDTYIKAFAHLESFQGNMKFLPWVRQIAANTARDWLKKKRPMLFTELNSGDEQDTPVEELFPDERSENLPEQVIEQQETKRLIREIIEELPEDQRAAIGMFYYEEMSVKEIASAMGVSESAVKSRLMYGRDKIEKKVRDLEKKGTKLYGLSPLPFLLLLFRSQKTYAAEAPDARILHTILAMRPAGAGATGAAAAGTAGFGAMSAGTTGTATGAAAVAGTAAGTAASGAGTAVGAAAAAAGSFGALKIVLITLAAAAVVGLGIFGAAQAASRLAEHSEPSSAEDVADGEKPEESAPGGEKSEDPAPSGGEKPEDSASDGGEEQEEPAPVEQALEQYRMIIGQADSYDYGSFAPDLELIGYQYALVQMQPEDPVPTLLLEKEEGGWTFAGNIRFFQYDPDTKTVRQPAEILVEGVRDVYAMAGDGYGIFNTVWSGGTGDASITRITLEGDSLKWDIYWKGQIFEQPDSITSIAIEWYEIGDLSPLENWTVPGTGETAPVPEEVIFTGPEDRFCTSYVIPEGVTRIEESAFRDCANLTSVEIPDSVTEIGKSAFSGCVSLTSVEIPDSVTEIGKSAFSNCVSLTSIEIPAGVTMIEAGTFSGCKSLTSVEIPDGVTEIGSDAFSGCRSLTGINLPDSVTEIGDYAFSSCDGLTSIKIPAGVTIIRDATFIECYALTSVEIPAGVTEIQVEAFVGCSSLTSIKLPKGINLAEMSLPDGIEIIYY